MVRTLLQAGADPSCRWSEQTKPTPLMEAAWCGHPGVARLLLLHGADAGLRNARGETALMLAQQRHHAQVVAVLVEWQRGGRQRD
jgi:ankyrin repeat protein